MDGPNSNSNSKSKPNEIRRRGKGKQTGNTKANASEINTKSNAATATATATASKTSGSRAPSSPPIPDSKSGSDSKPILLLTALVLVPYGLYNAYLYVMLQRPEWLLPLAAAASGLLPSAEMIFVRPSVGVGDPRRVLIVGTMSSGTTQLAHDLASTLGLEIGHENSETRWSFVRDGTVSWFHGIRFLPRPGIDDATRVVLDFASPKAKAKEPPSESKDGTEAEAASSESNRVTNTITLEGEILFRYVVGSLCRELKPNMGFHPFMFRDNGKCSLRQSWNSCWREDCKNLLEEEWGCALREWEREQSLPLSPSSSSSCTTPYHKQLLQVRHPLRTVESLVTKFCIGGVEGDVQPSFLLFAKSLFPQHDFSKLSCIEAAGYYVYEYNTAVLWAAKRGVIDDVYSVEGATPCVVAKLAGFAEERAGEEGHERRIRENLSAICRDENENELEHERRTGKGGNGANRPMVSTENSYNQGRLSLDWDDLLGGKHGSQKEHGDRDLKQRLKTMAEEELHYN